MDIDKSQFKLKGVATKGAIKIPSDSMIDLRINIIPFGVIGLEIFHGEKIGEMVILNNPSEIKRLGEALIKLAEQDISVK